MSKATRETELLKAFGAWVARLRKEERMTQQQLAEATEMSVVAIAYIENGKRWPRLATMDKLAKALGYRLYDLFRAFENK